MSTEIRKLAFFVEGQTEQIFLNRLVLYLLGEENVTLILKIVRGGTNSPKHRFVKSISSAKDPLCQVLIVDCGSDNKVKSEIMENIENLRANGYEKIIGLRDLYPIPFEEYPKLVKGLRFLPQWLKTESSHFDVIVAVHEIEAWFLGEINHYRKINQRLTGNLIKSKLGFNPFTGNMELREHPAKDLDDIYQLVGKSYTKHFGQTRKIVQRLDLSYMVNIQTRKMKSLAELIRIIKDFG